MPNEFKVKNGLIVDQGGANITGSSNISGSLGILSSGSNVFTVDGTSGRLFSVDDSLSGSLFSVNTAAGLPIMEAFSDNTVRIGQYGQKALFVSQSRVGIGKESALGAVLDVSGSVLVTGSLSVTSGITGSLFGTASWANNAVTSSFALTASVVTGTVASASYAFTASSAISASQAQTASYVLNSVSSSYAFTASSAVNSTNALTASSADNFVVRQSITASNALINGTITAQTLVVQTITASTEYITGSTIFGSLLTNTHDFTGSVRITGSLSTIGTNTLIGTTTLTGSVNITGSTTQIGNNTLLGNTLLSGSIIISGSQGPGNTASVQIYGDIRQTGYHRFDPINTSIDTSISASYIYVSGSTQDLYFSQNGEGYSNITRLRWLEANLYTGLLHGGLITTQSSTVYKVSSGSGIIVTMNASIAQDPYPTIQFLEWPTLSASIAPLSASYDQSFIAILSSSAIGAQGTPYSDGDFNTKIPIGIVLHQNNSTINGVQTFPSVAYGWKQRTNDFIRAFGALKISGYILAPSGSSTRGLVLSGGTSWVDGRNYTIDPSNPSYITEATGITTSKIFRYRQSGSDWVYDTNAGVGYTSIDPTQYSNNGVLTPVPTNHWSIQRVFYFPNSATKALFTYYGNAEYANETEALAAVGTETFAEAPNTAASALYIGFILVRHNADFTVPASYQIYEAGLFRGSGESFGAGGAPTTLAALSDVLLTSPTDGQALVYDSADARWENKSFISASISGTASYAANGGVTQIIAGTNVTISPTSGTGSVTINAAAGAAFPFTGSALITGSLVVTGSIISTLGFTGSLFGTASWANNVISASYVLNAVSSSFATTASYVLNAVSASQAANAVLLNNTSSAIFATTGSNTFIGNQTITGSLTISGSITATSSITGSSILLTQVTSSIVNPFGDIVLTPMSASINTGSVELQGGFKLKRTSTAPSTEIGDLITFGGTMGLIEGGTLTTSSVGGLVAQAGEAVMYTMNTFPYGTHNLVKFTTIGTTDASRQITLPQTSSVYVYYNNSGVLTSAATAPSSRSNIILGKVTTDASNIIYIDASQINAHHYSNYVDRLLREALGPIFSTGGITTQGTTSGSLNVTAATYFFSQNRITTNAGTNISMDTFYRSTTSGQYVRTTGVSLVNTSSYDSGSGALVSIPSGKYVKHSLYLLGDNSLQATATEAYMMVYGQNLYDSKGDAEAGSLPSPPSYFTDAVSIIASLVVTPDSQSIQTVIDERPRLGFVSPSKTGVITAHGDLSGLSNDDHPQYLLVDGTRQMSGDLGLGGNDLYNFSLISGSSITASNATITSITGSLFGTASWALNFITGSVTSASYAFTASSAISASYVLNSISASYAFTASSAISSSRSISSSYAFTASSAVSSYTASSAVSASLSISSSYAFTASSAVSSSISITSSYSLNVDGGFY